MILSTLGRKVLNETNIPEDDIEWYWWIERRLQDARINGLVKMINGSSKMERNHIDGYWNKYRYWAARPQFEKIIISNHRWLFDLLQMLDFDFPWGLWSDLINIPVSESEDFAKALYKSHCAGRGNLSYAMAIYRGERERKCKLQAEIDEQMQQNWELLDIKSNDFDDSKRDEWENIKNNI